MFLSKISFIQRFHQTNFNFYQNSLIILIQPISLSSSNHSTTDYEDENTQPATKLESFLQSFRNDKLIYIYQHDYIRVVRPVSLFNEIEIRLVRISKCRGAHVCLSNNRKDTSPFCLPVCPHVKFVNIQLRGKELGVYEFLHFLRVRQDETSESILLSPCHQCARERFLSTVIYTR